MRLEVAISHLKKRKIIGKVDSKKKAVKSHTERSSDLAAIVGPD